MSDASSLDGHVSIITGAGQGLGRGVALAMASNGAKVALLGRTVSKCEAVAAEVAERGGEALAVACDVEDRESVDAAVAQVIEQWGRIDDLVNNAQTLAYASVRRLTEDQLLSMYQSGPMGTFRMQQACFEHLRAAKGSVVNMGSGSSILPHPAMAGYAMAKEAIRILTRVTALEWARHGIRVNAVNPLAQTPGFDMFDDTTGAGDESVLPEIPIGYMGDPEADVAPAVVFLCSPAAHYITGTTLMADGGYNFLR